MVAMLFNQKLNKMGSIEFFINDMCVRFMVFRELVFRGKAKRLVNVN